MFQSRRKLLPFFGHGSMSNKLQETLNIFSDGIFTNHSKIYLQPFEIKCKNVWDVSLPLRYPYILAVLLKASLP